MAAQQVAFRLRDEILSRVDELMPALSTKWRDATRSDVLRVLILSALAIVERDGISAGQPKPRLASPRSGRRASGGPSRGAALPAPKQRRRPTKRSAPKRGEP